MNSPVTTWQFWAVRSVAFAAVTAVFTKIRVENINSDFATFVRTIVILFVLGGILLGTAQRQPVGSVRGMHLSVPWPLRPRNRGILAVLFRRAPAW